MQQQTHQNAAASAAADAAAHAAAKHDSKYTNRRNSKRSSGKRCRKGAVVWHFSVYDMLTAALSIKTPPSSSFCFYAVSYCSRCSMPFAIALFRAFHVPFFLRRPTFFQDFPYFSFRMIPCVSRASIRVYFASSIVK